MYTYNLPQKTASSLVCLGQNLLCSCQQAMVTEILETALLNSQFRTRSERKSRLQTPQRHTHATEKKNLVNEIIVMNFYVVSRACIR